MKEVEPWLLIRRFATLMPTHEGSTTMADLMAGLPPLLLGIYAEDRCQRAVWRFRPNSAPSWGRAWSWPRPGTVRVPAAVRTNFDVSPRRFSVCRWETKPPANTCVCSFRCRRPAAGQAGAACWCPQMLRDYANLGSDVVVIGVGTRAELWNKDAWESYLAEKEEGYSDIADDVLPEVEFLMVDVAEYSSAGICLTIA